MNPTVITSKSFLAGFASLLVLMTPVLKANTIDLLETFESPAISAGTTTSTLPPGWTVFSGPSNGRMIVNPGNTADFNQIGPLASPAGGNQYLILTGTNSGIDRMSGVTIQANTVYTLSAAIGNSTAATGDQNWSIQLWADTNHNGVFDGSPGGDTFIGQQFGTSGTAINASNGAWATNSFTFDSQTASTLLNQQLIVFVNNFGSTSSYYDNVTLTQSVPESSPGIIGFMAIVGILCCHTRRGRDLSSAGIPR